MLLCLATCTRTETRTGRRRPAASRPIPVGRHGRLIDTGPRRRSSTTRSTLCVRVPATLGDLNQNGGSVRFRGSSASSICIDWSEQPHSGSPSRSRCAQDRMDRARRANRRSRSGDVRGQRRPSKKRLKNQGANGDRCAKAPGFKGAMSAELRRSASSNALGDKRHTGMRPVWFGSALRWPRRLEKRAEEA